MVIFFVSPKIELFVPLASMLEKEGHNCLLFRNHVLFLNEIESGKSCCHLMCLDYSAWNHENFNVFSELNDYHLYIPYFFFNDPVPFYPSPSLDVQWSKFIENYLLTYEPEILQPNIKEINKVLRIISSYISDPEIKSYLFYKNPLPYDAKKVPQKLFYERKTKIPQHEVETFVKKVHLPENLHFLLKLFAENTEMCFSSEEITKYYSDNCRRLNEDSLKVLISKLRKYLTKDKNFNYEIIKFKKGYILTEIPQNE